MKFTREKMEALLESEAQTLEELKDEKARCNIGIMWR